MKLNKDSIDEFKDYLVQSVNDDIYYQLKDWVANYDWSNESFDEGEDDFDKIIDYFIENLHGSLQWVETEPHRPHTYQGLFQK